jgi:hypothetical protein
MDTTKTATATNQVAAEKIADVWLIAVAADDRQLHASSNDAIDELQRGEVLLAAVPRVLRAHARLSAEDLARVADLRTTTLWRQLVARCLEPPIWAGPVRSR